MEFEMIDNVAEMFESAEAEAEAAGLGTAAEVKNSSEVAEMAHGPAINAADASASQSAIQNFINNNPYGKVLWSFAKTAASETAKASLIFGVMYGLNKAIAGNAQSTGNRTALSTYLQQVQNNFTQNLGLPWTSDLKQQTAEAALSFPWIDASK